METGNRVLGAERQRSTQDPKAKESDVTATARNGRLRSVTRFLSYLPRSKKQYQNYPIVIERKAIAGRPLQVIEQRVILPLCLRLLEANEDAIRRAGRNA